MPINSHIQYVERAISEKADRFAESGIEIYVAKRLQYGIQYAVSKGPESGTVNVYYSKKKGISVVDNSTNAVTGETTAIIEGKTYIPDPSLGIQERGFNTWIGTDESGKGDFFGPLVVCGFLVTSDIIEELEDAGVKDSKKLNRFEIAEISGFLRERFQDRYSLFAPDNTEYNRMYKETKNLNRLLAIGHGRVVKALIEKTGEGNDVMSIDGVVSDQFGQKALLEEEIANKYGLKLVQRHSGESNIGVAAASIIARDHFEKRVRSLSEMLAMPLPLGAGNEVRSAAAKIFEKFGRSRLCGTAKMHFKIFKELCYGIQ